MAKRKIVRASSTTLKSRLRVAYASAAVDRVRYQRVCTICGRPFYADHPKSRYCSECVHVAYKEVGRTWELSVVQEIRQQAIMAASGEEWRPFPKDQRFKVSKTTAKLLTPTGSFAKPYEARVKSGTGGCLMYKLRIKGVPTGISLKRLYEVTFGPLGLREYQCAHCDRTFKAARYYKYCPHRDCAKQADDQRRRQRAAMARMVEDICRVRSITREDVCKRLSVG